MLRLGVVLCALLGACGKGDTYRASSSRELARLPQMPVQIVRSGNHLIVKNGERLGPQQSIVIISLKDRTSDQLPQVTKGNLAADSVGVYWGDANGQVGVLDPATETIKPLAKVDGAVTGISASATHLLVAFDNWSSRTAPLVWIDRTSGTQTRVGAPVAAVADPTPMTILDGVGYVGIGHSEFDEVRLDGTSRRATIEGKPVAVCAFGDRIVSVLYKDQQYRIRSALRDSANTPESTYLAIGYADSFACGTKSLYVLHDNVIDRIDGGRLIRVVPGEAERGGALFVDDSAVYWGERDSKGWALRTLALER